MLHNWREVRLQFTDMEKQLKIFRCNSLEHILQNSENGVNIALVAKYAIRSETLAS